MCDSGWTPLSRPRIRIAPSSRCTCTPESRTFAYYLVHWVDFYSLVAPANLSQLVNLALFKLSKVFEELADD